MAAVIQLFIFLIKKIATVDGKWSAVRDPRISREGCAYFYFFIPALPSTCLWAEANIYQFLEPHVLHIPEFYKPVIKLSVLRDWPLQGIYTTEMGRGYIWQVRVFFLPREPVYWATLSHSLVTCMHSTPRNV